MPGEGGEEKALLQRALGGDCRALAELLLGRLTTASRAAIRAETQLRVPEALNALDAIDRAVLVLRHFEMLSNAEIAQVLGLKPSAAGNRHRRALKRLEGIMAEV
jgi:RNA polymerase sigma-70 factor (ECF subfamily)